ncbi:Histone-lysine N-methyltransferase [Hyphodiscus hymeniophilus]|uniref:Histone-lysine N-methyltransferase SET9 n=1 Tax=Hyphodiscus hymeniophilus TaxID=353542 RepID=A0A9P6VH56_9HELO|nr:Histone-lysine N-methyltransferase [Hyphodiscus hymeniophilus]
MPSQTSPKKQRLTLAQLTSYDDILTDALVDKTFFWTNIRKNKSSYRPCREIREDDVTSIIQDSVIVKKDTAKAESQLLALSGLRKFMENLKTEKEKDDFRKHLRRYVNTYSLDCPFEVSSTNRYTVVTQEAAVIARRFIRKGEVVKYLCGVQVVMTEEEEDLIKHTRRDFSIVISSRKGSASLFLGPARFANHDCGANARLQTAGKDGMEIYAIQDIDIGDEITVSYGENYFGEDNCECLCKTCEDGCRNGWTADEHADLGTPKVSIEEPEGYSFRRRRYGSSPLSRDHSETPDVNIRPKVSKTPRSLSRFKNAEASPLGRSPSVAPTVTPNAKRTRESDFLSPSPAPKKFKKAPIMKEEGTEAVFALPAIEAAVHNPSPTTSTSESEQIMKEEATDAAFALPTIEAAVHNPSPTTSTSESAQNSPAPSSEEATGTDATSVDEDTIIVQPLLNPTISKLRRSQNATIPGSLEQAEAGATILVGQSTSTAHPVLQDDNASILSELPSELELDDSTMSITVKSPNSKRKRGRPSTAGNRTLLTPKPSTKKRARKLPTPKTDVDHAPPVRVPGDYVLTPALLAEPASSWIVCKNCAGAFVQKDAYFTRSTCPRCERHSKLYGYEWPKTDRDGPDDTEERVLDHREIHRFLYPKEEKTARKRGRESMSQTATREDSEVVFKVEEEGRRSKRARRTIM